MPEDQRRILEMLASKQISVEEADRLLEVITPVPLRGGLPTAERAQARSHQHEHSHRSRPHGGATTDGGAYLREMRAVGLRDLAPHDLIGLKSTGVTAAFVREMRAHGLTTLEPHDLIALKSTGVDGAYIQGLRDAGLEGLDAQDLIAFRSQDIDGGYVRRMRAAGFADLAPGDLIGLKSQGIDADDESSDDLDEGSEDARDNALDIQEASGETVRLLSVGEDPDTAEVHRSS